MKSHSMITHLNRCIVETTSQVHLPGKPYLRLETCLPRTDLFCWIVTISSLYNWYFNILIMSNLNILYHRIVFETGDLCEIDGNSNWRCIIVILVSTRRCHFQTDLMLDKLETFLSIPINCLMNASPKCLLYLKITVGMIWLSHNHRCCVRNCWLHFTQIPVSARSVRRWNFDKSSSNHVYSQSITNFQQTLHRNYGLVTRTWEHLLVIPFRFEIVGLQRRLVNQ